MTQGPPAREDADRAARVLVVDDDPLARGSLLEWLRTRGCQASSAGTLDDALAILREAEEGDRPIEVVFFDLSPGNDDPLESLRRIRDAHSSIATIAMTAYGSVDSAVRSLRLGATDYLTKPLVDEEARCALERAIAYHRLLADNARLHRRLDRRLGLENIVGGDPRMEKIFDLVEAVAPSRTTVLMSGESGVGKSLIAHAIHNRSPRRSRPFVELSCGSIPETLLESELFGHVKGAFTGAHADKAGRFLAADTGTIFLDEINSASPAMQLKLLRVLQERKFEPVGASQTVEVDVRVLLATNQPLEDLVAAGTFRQDLYYRINVVRIDLPALRDRPRDIPALARHFLDVHAGELGKQIAGFSPEAIDALTAYAFPGNVRELSNIVERAAVLCKRQTIALEDLPDHVVRPAAPRLVAAEAGAAVGEWSGQTLEEAMKEPERRILLAALRANAGNRQRTADRLGINRTTLYKKLKALGIDPELPRLAG